MDRICAGVVKRPSMAPYNGFGKRTPSQRPPVLTPAEVSGLNGATAVSANGHGAAPSPTGDVGSPTPGR